MTQQQAPLPLAGFRVLELGNFIAAPTAGRLLADFGAEVVKVERPGRGDELRQWRLNGGSTSMLFRTINRNKLSVALDLRSTQGREAVLRLVAHCDAVIENFRPGTLEKWGLGPDVLSEVNPDLVITRISAYGQTGPLRERPGFAAVAEAVGGLRTLVGEPDRPPARVGVSIGDSLAGLYAAFGTVMQLLARRGPHAADQPGSPIVDVALNEAVLSVLESVLPDYSAHGRIATRSGGRIEGIAPSNAYSCADGSSVVIAGNSDGIFRRLMELVGRPDLSVDPGCATNHGRWQRRDELDEVIEAWTSMHDSDQVLVLLDAADVPAGRINTAADLCDDAQLQARNMVQHLVVDTGDPDPVPVAFPGVVPVLGEASLPVRSLGPDLGAHTREVLTKLLGMSPAEVDAFKLAGGAA